MIAARGERAQVGMPIFLDPVEQPFGESIRPTAEWKLNLTRLG
jgi:hypothetical protein